MEVEHFVCKTLDSSLVVEWNNLLPSCKRCNGRKSTHDVRVEPLVNPYDDTPSQHLKLHLYRLVKKTEKGQNTIGALDLNDSNRMVLKRFQIGEGISSAVQLMLNQVEKYKESNTARRRNALCGTVRNILAECHKEAEYSATTASVLLSDEDFQFVVGEMKRLGVWGEDMESSYVVAESIRLDV